MVGASDFWHIPAGDVTIMYVVAVISVATLCIGFWSKTRIWMMGSDGDGSLKSLTPLGFLRISLAKFFSADCLLARRVFPRSKARALLLIGIVWGFLLLFLGTVARTINSHFYHFLYGNVWFVFSFVLDVAGFFLLVGTVFGLLRRYVWQPEKMTASIRDGVFLFWLLFVVLTGFIVKGVRMIALGAPPVDWSPVGYLFGVAVRGISGGDANTLQAVHQTVWLVHMFLALFFIAYIPFSKGFHMMASQITTSLAAERKQQRASSAGGLTA
ncbi:MAG: hypothetical protein ACLPYB_09940 [Desulfobaccales bacterium]